MNSDRVKIELVASFRVSSVEISPVTCSCTFEKYFVFGYFDGTISFFDSQRHTAKLKIDVEPVFEILNYGGGLLIACGPKIFALNPFNLVEFRLLHQYDQDCVGGLICGDHLLIQLKHAEYLQVAVLDPENIKISHSFVLRCSQKCEIVHFCMSNQLIFVLF